MARSWSVLSLPHSSTSTGPCHCVKGTRPALSLKQTFDTPLRPIVEITALRKSYGSNEVLKGIDLKVTQGEVIAIIGKSGSGKSTLLRCINGLEVFQEGVLAVEGMTLLMVTHEMSFARKVSNRVIFMHQVRVHEMRPPTELFGNPQTPDLKQFLSSLHD